MNNSNGEVGSMVTLIAVAMVILAAIVAAGFWWGRTSVNPGDVVAKMEADRKLLVDAYDAKIKDMNKKLLEQTDKIATLYQTAVLKQQKISALTAKLHMIQTPQTPAELRKRFTKLGFPPIGNREGEK